MNRFDAVILGFALVMPAHAQVKTGLDVLIDENFQSLAGKRVGLATNQTGISSDDRRNIDVFAHAPGVKLTAIFAFEHGISAPGGHPHIVADVHEPTGVPFSAPHTGGVPKPTAAMLKDVD